MLFRITEDSLVHTQHSSLLTTSVTFLYLTGQSLLSLPRILYHNAVVSITLRREILPLYQ